jgi:hypothetical protein
MHYHPTLATALAQTRVADLHETAGRTQQARRTLAADTADVVVSANRLDAYPRLGRLLVTIERSARR